MELKDLVGKHLLSGVDYTNGSDGEMNVLFCLDGVTYEAREDPDDGYRSYMKDLKTTKKRCTNEFPAQPVVCEWTDSESNYGVDDILLIKDAKNGLVVLKIGTCNTNDYYPWCEMEYTPENLSCNRS